MIPMELKKIYLLHHSHYDRGYTHSQVIIDNLQADFITQAIEMMEATRDWEAGSQPRWTIEVHEQLRRWLVGATPEEIARLKQQVADGRIGLGAIQYNTTPLGSVESLCKQLVEIRTYREKLGFPVRVAFQHDVTGIPWVMSDLLLDAGIELLVMAINLHTGGNGPKRPGVFNWRTPQGRVLKVFSGHHYGTFDSVTEPVFTPLAEMKTNMDRFWQGIVDDGYAHDFLYLSTTHSPVADDNGGPCIMSAEKVREWNRQEGYPSIEYVTPEQLIEKLNCVPEAALPEHRGDWTDFWNYGAGSTALETALNANSKQKLFSSGLLATQLPVNDRLIQRQRDAWDEVVCYDEHTWGMDCQASKPNHAHCIAAGMKKRMMAHEGQELARYVLASRLATYAGNPVMFETEGLLALNPSPVAKRVCVNVLPRWRKIFGHLNGFQYRHSEAENLVGELDAFPDPGGKQVQVEVGPFSATRVPWVQCAAPEADDSLQEGRTDTGAATIESATHLLEYHPDTGRILRLFDKANGWDVLAASGDYDLLEPVHEKPDPSVDASRKSYYKRELEIERALGSCWNPDWKAVRTGAHAFRGCKVVRDARTISLIREVALEGASRVIQKFELSADHPWIEVGIIIHKDKVETPEAIYFVSQLNLKENWEATFDSSGVPVKLDEEQLEHSSRGWITAEAFTRMEDASHQFSVFAPGTPLAQLGNFHFGEPPLAIPRQTQPLHLLWGCNNYWETNFPVTQEGVIRLSCAIHTAKGASNADTYRQADAFFRKPLFLPLASCEETGTHALVVVDNPKVRLLSIDAARYSDDTIYRVANYEATAQACALDVGADIVEAAVVSATEEMMTHCECNGQSVMLDVAANAIVSVRVKTLR
jgi:alpha-mannosidase